MIGPPEAPETQVVPSEADTATLPQQSAPAQEQPSGAPASPAAPAQQPAAAAVPVPPNLVKPAKRGGLAGILDEIADDVAGTQGPGKVYTDKEGNQYIDHPALSRKGQWLKIAAEAVHGAAAGAAAAPGPGQLGRAANAGVNAGEQMEEKEHTRDTEQSQDVRQANQDRFNQIKLKHDMAAKEFELARLKVQATQADTQFAQEQEDRMAKLVQDGKAFDLGTYQDEADLARVKEQNPNFWKDVYQNNISAVPVIGPDGKRGGIHLFQTTPGVGNDPEAGLTFHVFTPPTKPGDAPTMKVQTASVPMSPNQAHAYDLAAYGQMQKWQTDQKEQELKGSEITKNQAEAAKDRAEAAKTKQETAEGASDSLVQDVLGGHVVPERLGYLLGKKEGQQLLERISSAAKAQGVDLDIGKLQAYPKVYDQFASTKPGTAGFALNAGATALQHLAELEALNTNTSRVPNTAASKAFLNKLDTVVPELIKFYGMPDTDKSVTALKSSMGGFFNRGAAIKQQVKSMGDKIQNYEQQWKNAAPSKAYEAPMPGLSDKAKMARAELDPDYAKRLFSVSKWKAVNPNGDAIAARKQALAQQFDVIE